MTELEAANQKEKKAKQIREMRNRQDDRIAEDSGTETEDAINRHDGVTNQRQSEKLLAPDDGQGSIRKRRNSGEVSSGDLSTDSEWDKVDEANEIGR